MQLKVLTEKKRFNVVDCGRRWGKTLMGEDLAIEAALAGLRVGWFAPEYKYMAEAWRDLLKALDPYISYKNVTERRMELVTGGVIEMWSLDSGDGGRSRKYSRAIIDEAAMVPGLMQIWNDAIRGALVDLKGDAWFLSTPRGRNDFWQLYLWGLDPMQEDWMCWQMPTSANPFIDPEEIEAARRELPEKSFSQEFLAEFLEDGAVFDGIQAIATAQEQKYKDYNLGHTYVMGTDFAKYNDYTVFTVFDATLKEMCYMERSNKTDYLVQIERLKELIKRFDIKQVMVESAGNAVLIEILSDMRLPIRVYALHNESKYELIDGLRKAIEGHKIKILNDPVLIGELRAFEMTRTKDGIHYRFAAPKGYHDDCVMSLALGWEAVKNYQPIKIINRNREKYGQYSDVRHRMYGRYS